VRSAAVASVFLVAGALAVTVAPEAFFTYVLVGICINALLAVSVRLVLLIGEVNLAAAAFFGIGAYAAAVLTVDMHMPSLAAIAAGALFAAVAAFVFGAITLGTTGAYFLLITFAFTEVIRLIYTQTDSIGGNSGIVGIVPDFDWLPTLVVVVTVLVIYALYRLEQSRYGTVMRAVEGHTNLAECLGFRTRLVKTAVFSLACAVAGLAGGLYANFNVVISPGDFGFMVSIYAIAWLVIGGRGHILGPVLGAAALTILAQALQGFGDYDKVVYGLALIIGTLVLPGGLWGLLTAAVRMVMPTRPISTPDSPLPTHGQQDEGSSKTIDQGAA